MIHPTPARGLSRAPFPDAAVCTLYVPPHPPQGQAGLLEDTATCCVWPPNTTRRSSPKLSHRSNTAKGTEHSQGCESALSPRTHRQTWTDTHSRVSAPPPWLLRTELGLHPCPQLLRVLLQGPPCTHGHWEPLTQGPSQARKGTARQSRPPATVRTGLALSVPPALLFSHTCSPPNDWLPPLSPPLVSP